MPWILSLAIAGMAVASAAVLLASAVR
jgi:hypothetical protein